MAYQHQGYNCSLHICHFSIAPNWVREMAIDQGLHQQKSPLAYFEFFSAFLSDPQRVVAADYYGAIAIFRSLVQDEVDLTLTLR